MAQSISINGTRFDPDYIILEQYTKDEIVVIAYDAPFDSKFVIARIPSIIWRTSSIRVSGSHYLEIANGDNTRVIASDLDLEV